MSERKKRRLTKAYPLSVCENGHVEAIGEGEDTWEIICPKCNQWTWDSNYCVWCGSKLK